MGIRRDSSMLTTQANNEERSHCKVSMGCAVLYAVFFENFPVVIKVLLVCVGIVHRSFVSSNAT